MKKILILNGNPKLSSLCGAIAEACAEAHRLAGHEVRLLHLAKMDFDPVLHHGYAQIQPLEPALQQLQADVKWCEHWVIVYPTWWGSLPAKLKGIFDRAFLSGFGYKYHKKGPFWDKLLKGRSATLITTMDAPLWWNWWMYRNAGLNTLRRPILEFCGFGPVRTRVIDRVKDRKPEQLAAAIRKAAQFSLN